MNHEKNMAHSSIGEVLEGFDDVTYTNDDVSISTTDTFTKDPVNNKENPT
jgi:4-diphosphocytidyl-2C-methyl-D-erythritol kinase